MRAPTSWVVVLGLSGLGCGEILEVPVGGGTTETSTGATAADTASGMAAGSTTPPDDDRSSGTAAPHEDDTGSSGGEPPLEIIPYCIETADIPDDGTVLELSVEVTDPRPAITVTSGLRIEHPRVQDLVIEVVGPDGTAVALLDEPACDRANIEAIFDDAATMLGNDACSTRPPAIVGEVAPLEPLGSIGTSQGTWTLRIEDVDPGDVGSLEQWCLAVGVEER